MYEYFIGCITLIEPAYIVLEVAGIGYRLQVANPYRYEVKDQPMRVYIFQAIRENDMTLFGFFDQDEKQIFEKLIKVSGIGPKSALAILANTDHEGLVQAIESDNVSYLVKFPGVGKKIAQQIILDLKGKMGQFTTEPQYQQTTTEDEGFIATDTPSFKESVAALKALGYTPREVKSIMPALREAALDDTDAYLREGLSLLMKK